MSSPPTYAHAEFMEQRGRLASGHQIAVNHARKNGRSLFHVRHPIGVTLDLCVTEQEARKSANKEGAAVEILEIRADGSATRLTPKY